MLKQSVLQALLLVSTASAIQLQGTPQLSKALPYNLKDWTGNSGNIPDGKMWSMRETPGDDSSPWIVWATPDLRMTSTTPYPDDATGPSPKEAIDVPGGTKLPGLNYATIPNDVPIPDAGTTGMRGDGKQYDENSLWIMAAFRLSETSQPDADSKSLIGFEHNEDYWKTAGGGDCTYKSIAVRYSHDLGQSWTRSVPIITKGTQSAECDPSHQFTGQGDFTAYWNKNETEWVIYAQNSVMSISKDPLGKPGTWTKTEPVSGRTAPGFISDEDDLAHGDLNDVDGVNYAGANPSIIFDSKNALYHMVWSQWGGGINHAQSSDLKRWDKPTKLITDEVVMKAAYPTLIGTGGDAETADGMATLIFTSTTEKAPADEEGWVGRPVYEILVNLS